MIHWKPLSSDDHLDHIIAKSYTHPILIFKHSTRCNISTIAKMRLEDQWDGSHPIDTYLLDLIRHRDLSFRIADTFAVHHESPQILLIKDGECFHDASHFDITAEEVSEVL